MAEASNGGTAGAPRLNRVILEEGMPCTRRPPPANSTTSLVTVTHVTYALHALGLAIGAFGASTVVGSFLFGWPSIIAVIINYVKRSEARGTWLESHFTWQIRTFWFAMLWACLVFLVGAAAGHRAGRLRDLDRRLHRPRHLGHLPHRPRLDGAERPARGALSGFRGAVAGRGLIGRPPAAAHATTRLRTTRHRALG